MKLYQSTRELPLHNFVDCLVDNNLHALVIDGKPTEAELNLQWEKIAEQYAAASGNQEYAIYLQTYKDAILLAVDFSDVQMIINTLKTVFYQPLLDKVNHILNTSVKLDGLQKEEYYKQLKSLDARSRALKIKADLKRSQFEAMQKKFDGTTGTPTREYFDTMLIILSDHAGYQITDRITVHEYCTRISRYNTQAKQAQTQPKKKAAWQK